MASVIIYTINIFYYALFILILARIVLSFVDLGYDIRNLVYRLTEPLLAPVRNVLPPMGGFDFSPMVVLLVAAVLRRLLITALI